MASLCLASAHPLGLPSFPSSYLHTTGHWLHCSLHFLSVPLHFSNKQPTSSLPAECRHACSKIKHGGKIPKIKHLSLPPQTFSLFSIQTSLPPLLLSSISLSLSSLYSNIKQNKNNKNFLYKTSSITKTVAFSLLWGWHA